MLTRMETAEKLSGLVHELQKERGIPAGYLVSQSKTNAVLLDAQRTITDQAKMWRRIWKIWQNWRR